MTPAKSSSFDVLSASLRAAIAEDGLTNREAARRLGIHESLLSKILSDKLEAVSGSTEGKIREFLSSRAEPSARRQAVGEQPTWKILAIHNGRKDTASLRHLETTLNQLASFSISHTRLGDPQSRIGEPGAGPTCVFDAALMIVYPPAPGPHRIGDITHRDYADLLVPTSVLKTLGVPIFALIARRPESSHGDQNHPFIEKMLCLLEEGAAKLQDFDNDEEFVFKLMTVITDMVEHLSTTGRGEDVGAQHDGANTRRQVVLTSRS